MFSKKNIIIAAFIGAVAVSGAFVFQFYWKNLRGIGPAVTPPSENIAALITKRLQNATDFPLALPEDFAISVFAQDLGKPRDIEFDPNGVVLVSLIDQGKVVALPDDDRDGVANELVTVVEGLNQPHGLAMHCVAGGCTLYVAQTNQVTAFEYDPDKLRAGSGIVIVTLPGGGRHFTRSLLINNDRLLIAVGSSCNVCDESDTNRTKILVSNFDGSNLREYARGLRNSVFLANHPITGQVWATEMGRDLIGNDVPPDEINIINEGSNYGYPVCYGKQIHDTDFDTNTYIRNPCEDTQPSYIDIPAHSAPLGLAFFPQQGWPQSYQNDLLVAYHGSWNRTPPTGYKIVRYELSDTGQYQGVEDFISGWLTSDTVSLGRPVDIAIQSNGSLYISDDKAGLIYRVDYVGR